MYTRDYKGQPDTYLCKSIKYERKEAVAAYNNKKIKSWIYKKLSKYYENKHLKNIGF